MTDAEADRLLETIHVAFPRLGLKKAGKIQPEAYALWKSRLVQYPYDIACEVIGEFYDGKLLPSGKRETPEWRDIRPHIAMRMAPRPAESGTQATPKALSLPFADGDYVTWPTQDSNALAGGIVRKRAGGDYIDGVPQYHELPTWRGWVLYSRFLAQPAEVARLRRMSPEQQENWTRRIRELEAAGELTSFGGLPGLMDSRRALPRMPDPAEEAKREDTRKARESVLAIARKLGRVKGE